MEPAPTQQAAEAQPKSSAPAVGPGLAGAPALPAAYDSAGVDRSLIRWMLSLTTSERLRHVQGAIDLVHKTKRVPNGDR